ncbi:ABC transporter permease [Chryseolinea sp. T2]|uniref:ABC transporter permease n=1 Tax=Chryseolinea sp. T2 TaxID=3129255 RepID=UPI0030781F3E
MFTNFLNTAIRSLLREKQYALIKIAGLSLGLGTSLVLMLYISLQLSYDEMHRDVDREYRVVMTNIWNATGGMFHSTGPAVSAALSDAIPEIESVMRINTPGSQLIKYQPSSGQSIIAYQEENVLAADSNFFSFFDFKLKQGNPNTALTGIGKVVLSEDAAKRLFGDEPALGKIIQLGDNNISVEVTGVTEKQPENIHFHFDYLFSMYTNAAVRQFEWSWIWTQMVTYVKLVPGADIKAVDAKVKTLADRYAPACFQRLGMDYKEFIGQRGGWFLALQPVRDVHLRSAEIGNRIGPVNDIMNVYILGSIAAIILALAVVNFVNLSTARGSKRAKEVGVKKTLGVTKSMLITQFQVENILLTSVAMLLGLGVMEILRFVIQPMLGIAIPLDIWSVPTIATVIIGVPLVVGFLGGLYPAFYLTSFRPAQVLKGKLATGFGSSRLRNALVVFQFTISIALMSSTLIVFQQLSYFQSRDTGIKSDNLLIVNYADKLGEQLKSFRNELVNMPGVNDAALSMDIRSSFEDIYTREGDNQKVSISAFKADEHFLSTSGIVLKVGRGFDANRPSDTNAVVITETTARALGWIGEEAIGKRILYLGDELGPLEVIGIAKDFNIQSLRQSIQPVMFLHIDSKYWGNNRIALVRYETSSFRSLVSSIESRWKQLSPAPFSYTVYNDHLRAQYRQEERIVSLFSIFTVLSIVIAVIGLVGLVAYSAEQRKKEIGIRKVFGATRGGIYVLINRPYVVLLAVSLTVATPLTWYLMQQWLDSFAYSTNISASTFILAGVIELVLALVCVGYLSLRATRLNPSVVLKDE